MEKENTRLRRYEDDLYVGGKGVIIIGLWSVIKVVIGLLLGTGSSVFGEARASFGEQTALMLTLFLGGVILIIALLLHLYVGINAVRAAEGKPCKKGYAAGAVFMLLLSLLSLIAYKDMFTEGSSIYTTLAGILMDLTTAYLFLIVIVSTGRIRKAGNSVNKRLQE